MTQSVLTIVADVGPGREAELTETLATIGGDPASNAILPLGQFDQLHFASLVLADGPEVTKLIFESNVDGTAAAWLTTLSKAAGGGLDALFLGSPGYPGSAAPARLQAWLAERVVRPGAFHIGATGRSVARIHQEQLLHDQISGFLAAEDEAGGLNGLTPNAVRTKVQTFVRNEPTLGWAATKPPPRETLMEKARHRLRAAAVVAAAVVLLPVLVPVVAVGYVVLRVKEKTDPVRQAPPDPAHIRRLEETEDLCVFEGASGPRLLAQNHLSSVIPVKPGMLRAALLPLVLFVLNLLARIIFTKGKLGNIPSIHFAHWSLIDERRHLLFLSNFDGSWESYLGDFIDKAAVGLTAVWSNTKEFPRTRNLLREGATDGPRFRQWARGSQCGTNAWYTAYPDLTMTAIDNNSALRDDLFRALDDQEAVTWLRRL